MSETELLKFTIGTEFNECSSASAELAGRAIEITRNPNNHSLQRLFVLEPEGVAERVLSVAPLSEEFDTAGNRPARYVLGFDSEAEEPRPLLLLEVPNRLALPVASFGRRPGSACDFVQIGPEMNDANIVVTPGDEFSRQDLIADLGIILSANPMALRYGAFLQDAKDDWRTWSLKSDVEEAIKTIDTFDWYGKAALGILAVAQLAEKIGEGHPGGVMNGHLDRVQNHPYKRRFRAAQVELERFMENPSMEAVLAQTAPGTEQSETAKKLLATLIGRKYGLVYNRHGSYGRDWRDPLATSFYGRDPYSWLRDEKDRRGGVRRLLDVLEADEALDAQLGKHDDGFGIITAHLARIAGQYWQATDKTQIQPRPDSLPISVDLRLELVPIDNQAHQVILETRPTHQDTAPYAELVREVIHRTQPNPLSPTKTKELSWRLPYLIPREAPTSVLETRQSAQPVKRRFGRRQR